MKIAFILTPITFGGAEKVSLTFLKGVDRTKFEIHPILLTRPWESETLLEREARKYGYECKTIPVATSSSGEPLRVVRVLKSIRNILKMGSFELIHTNGYFADICGLPAARSLGIKRISTCHGFISNDRKLNLYNSLDRLALRLSDTVIAVSEEIRDLLVCSGVRKNRIRVIENSVENSHGKDEPRDRRLVARRELSVGDEDFVIGFVGRLSEEKGVCYLIRAAADFMHVSKNRKVILVGDGPARSELVRLVKENGLENDVLFVGFQPNVAHWLSMMDAFVLPSLTEGTPMALLEAMSMGVPVIASAVGGVPKVVKDGLNGFLVEPGNVGQISERLRCLKEDRCLRESVAQAGVETIRTHYDAGRWCVRIQEEYDLLLNRKRSG